jgi:hypothetical protein
MDTVIISKENERTWSEQKRAVWWIKNIFQNLIMAIAIASSFGAGAYWFYTRASTMYVDVVAKQKLDVVIHEKDLEKTNLKIDKQEKFLRVIHTNVTKMLEHVDVKADTIKFEDDDRQ